MPTNVKAVFFDVDGVLLDSLPEHLQICRDKADEFGLKLKVPSVQEFRRRISDGEKVSPMLYFFLAVGFPREFANRAVDDYQREFMQHYRPKAFPGIDKVLSALEKSGLKLGLVTSNTRANVVPALGQAMRFFDVRCLFFFDKYPEPKSKSWCLANGAQLLCVKTQDCVYVGDQPSDAAAAKEANVQFLGVTYGWGITKNDKRYRAVDSVHEISDKLISQQSLL